MHISQPPHPTWLLFQWVIACKCRALFIQTLLLLTVQVKNVAMRVCSPWVTSDLQPWLIVWLDILVLFLNIIPWKVVIMISSCMFWRIIVVKAKDKRQVHMKIGSKMTLPKVIIHMEISPLTPAPPFRDGVWNFQSPFEHITKASKPATASSGNLCHGQWFVSSCHWANMNLKSWIQLIKTVC